MKADMTTELTDDALLHLKDTHVGDPTEKLPLTNADWINFARAAIYADRALRSRAASEPGEVARLAEEAKARARNAATLPRDPEPRRMQLEACIAAIDRLASMATSPASEAQADADAKNWKAEQAALMRLGRLREAVDRVFQPAPMPSYDTAVKMLAFIDGDKPWASTCAPLPASSPVAAEGQKADDDTLRHKISDLFKIGRDVRNDATIIANATNAMHLVDCLMAVERELFTTMVPDEDGEEGDQIEECSVNSWGSEPAQYVEQVRAAIAAIATPTASMADAADAVQHDESDPLQQLTDLSQELGLYEVSPSQDGGASAATLARWRRWLLGYEWQPNWSAASVCLAIADEIRATPGPRGENAGGVWISVEDRLPEVVGARNLGSRTLYSDRVVVLHKNGHTTCDRIYKEGGAPVQWGFDDLRHPGAYATHWMPLPPAPDRGLRIAEKGDAS